MAVDQHDGVINGTGGPVNAIRKFARISLQDHCHARLSAPGAARFPHCITGPSNAGKSTLALALARKLGIRAVHFDQLYHRPGTDWTPRPAREFERLHAEAVKGDRWIIDGNYARLIAARLERATAIIILRSGRWSSLGRYVRRTLSRQHRAGDLEGARKRIRWQMIRYILGKQPAQGVRREALLRASPLPKIEINSMRELRELWRAWGLT